MMSRSACTSSVLTEYGGSRKTTSYGARGGVASTVPSTIRGAAFNAAKAEVSGTGRVLYYAKDIWPHFISCVLVVRLWRADSGELVATFTHEGGLTAAGLSVRAVHGIRGFSDLVPRSDADPAAAERLAPAVPPAPDPALYRPPRDSRASRAPRSPFSPLAFWAFSLSRCSSQASASSARPQRPIAWRPAPAPIGCARLPRSARR